MKLSRHRSIAAVLAIALLAAGCANTIRGAGRDISNATDATADAVDEIAN